MPPLIDLTGQRFGRLFVIERRGSANDKSAMWLCECDCGTKKVIRGKDLRTGATQSCGCYLRESARERATRHGLSNTKLYVVWEGMRNRCSGRDVPEFKCYTLRKTKVCDEWDDFGSFYEWAMANGYQEGLTIDRIDNAGDYCPQNCRWATWEEQANNKTTNRFIEFNGETLTVAQWARKIGVEPYVITDRLTKYGWSVERTLTTPVRKRKEQQHERIDLRPVRRRQNSMQHYGDCTEQR